MKLSIRYQIVGLVVTLLTGAMAAYLGLANSLLTEDKLATVYDMNSLLAGTVSEEVRAGLGSLVDKLLYFGAEQLSAGDSGGVTDRRARALFQADHDVLAIELWERTEHDSFRRRYAYVDGARLASLNLSERELEASRKETPVPLDAIAAQRVLLQNASLSPDVALLRLGAANAEGTMLVVAELRPDRLLRIFGRSALYTVYLVDHRGRVLVHPEPAKMIGHADASGIPVVQDALEANLSRGAREFDGEHGATLGAFSHVDLGRLTVVVEAPRAPALAASRDLTRRSLLFGLSVVSITLAVSIYLSRWLAKPLRTLQHTMAAISRGEFGVEVPVTSRNEIGAVAEAFNRMSKELSDREQQLMEKSHQLIQSEKLSAIGELSAGLAHEVKNPMVGIVGFSQLGLESTNLEEAQEYFRLIEADAQRANGILQNLLEFARPQRVELEQLDPNSVVQGAVRLVHHQLQLAGVRLNTHVTEGLPRITGNQNQLRQVLINLMMNAGQAMESAPERVLSVSTGQDATGAVVIEVRDTGSGMSEEVRKKLFQPFFTTKPRGKGTGLGLSVSSSIIAQHRGEIRVESEPGRGATFTIRLPPRGGHSLASSTDSFPVSRPPPTS